VGHFSRLGAHLLLEGFSIFDPKVPHFSSYPVRPPGGPQVWSGGRLVGPTGADARYTTTRLPLGCRIDEDHDL
jgi:hypothetical protein